MTAARHRDAVSGAAPDFEIEVDGEPTPAYKGESVLSVLFALGRREIYRDDHQRALGAWCGMGVCYSCLVEIDGQAKQRSCQVAVRPGMEVRTRPAAEGRSWRARPSRCSGAEPSPARSRRVIVGAGPAGLNAALELARHGAGSLVIDENRAPGGAVYRQSERRAGRHPFAADKSHRRAARLFAEVADHAAQIDFLYGAQVVATFGDGRELAYLHAGELHRLPYEQLLLAPGCYEHGQPFPGWDLPGVMSVGGAQAQAKRGWVRPAAKMALVGTGPLLLVAAVQLHRAGVEVAGVFEAGRRRDLALQWPRLLVHPALLAEGAGYLLDLYKAGVPVHHGWGIVAARGNGALEEVTVAPYDAAWRPDLRRARKLAVDGLGVGYGYSSRAQLSQLLGCRQSQDRATGGRRPRVDEWQRTSRPGVFAAGDGVGVYGSETAACEGRLAALGLLCDAGELSAEQAAAEARPLRRELARLRLFRTAFDRFSTPRPGLLDLPDAKTTICRCENVPFSELASAVDSGIGTFSALKMATRVGMGDCQGRMCSAFACEYLRRKTGRSAAAVGHPRPRVPLSPIPFSALTGPSGDPT